MKRASQVFNVLNFFFSLAAIGALIWFHGYTYRPEFFGQHLVFLHICFAFYLLQFVFRAVESGEWRAYLERNQAEYLLFLTMIVSMLINWWLDFSMVRWALSFTGIEDQEILFILFLHIWLLLIVGIEMGRAAMRSTVWSLSPPVLFILSFLVLIAIGSSLLMLPEMTAGSEGMSFVDALFTSVSANCVTGLSVVDTATYFSAKGHFLLLLLIQAGGLNIIFFATFFISRYHKEITTPRHDRSVEELFHTASLHGETMSRLLKRVVVTALLIEFIGVLVIYNQWGSEVVFDSQSQRLFYSVFHAVSAFNNAGFTLFTDGFTHEAVVGNEALHISLGLLIILGGIGFTTIWDLIKRMFAIGTRSVRQAFRLDTKVSIISSLILLLLGGVLFYLLEHQGTLSDAPASDFTTSFFQSITARTAGFKTVDIAAVGAGTMVLLIFLMLIGTCSGATGGGIKTSTATVLLFAAWRQLRRERAPKAAKFVTTGMIHKAIAILLSAVCVMLLGTLVLLVTETDQSFGDLLFEEVSAFGTVGLSRGLTPELSATGKGIVMGTMLLGRVGPLAVAYALIGDERLHQRTRVEGFMIG